MGTKAHKNTCQYCITKVSKVRLGSLEFIDEAMERLKFLNKESDLSRSFFALCKPFWYRHKSWKDKREKDIR